VNCRCFVAALFAIGIVTHASNPWAQSAVTGELAEVRQLINAGEPKKALERLTVLPAEADEGRRMQAELLRGVAYYHAGDASKAIEALVAIVDRLPSGSIDQREAEQVLGLSLFVAGRFADALPRLEATRRWAGANNELAYALGQAYIQTRNADAARNTFASMFRVAPDSAAAHLLLAQMMLRLEFEPQAETELAAALQKDARLPNANLLLGQVALFRGRLPEAIAHTERELTINPGNAMAFSQLGDALVRQAKWDDAIAALQKSVWLNPYYSAPYILLGRAYVKKDQLSTAEGMFRRAIEYDPNNRTAHYLLAQLLQQMGRVDEAKREFEIAERLRGTRGA
jgi:tetratricopeptide (TPR) repeat protein